MTNQIMTKPGNNQNFLKKRIEIARISSKWNAEGGTPIYSFVLFKAFRELLLLLSIYALRKQLAVPK